MPRPMPTTARHWAPRCRALDAACRRWRTTTAPTAWAASHRAGARRVSAHGWRRSPVPDRPAVALIVPDANLLQGTIDRVDLRDVDRADEHTSELQSLMRISYAVFCFVINNQHQHFINK